MRKKKKCFNCGYWNAPEALYCGLCYEPFNKKAPDPQRRPPAAAPAAPRGGAPAAASLLNAALAVLLAAGAGFYLLRPAAGPGTAAPAAPVNRFADKTDAADRLLADYIASKEALLAEITAAPADPEGFGLGGAWTTRLFDIEERYAGAINALQLPCPSCVDRERDAFYLEWSEIHRHRETRAMEDFGARYQKLIEKASAGTP